MRQPMKTQHCPALSKEQREVLDEAAREYGVPWHVKTGKHNKIYLGKVLVTVISLSRDTNSMGRFNPAARMRSQIKHAMGAR
jgi:hypothetical protein